MKKILSNKISLVLMLLMFMAVLHYIGSAERPSNLNSLPAIQASQMVSNTDTATRKTSGYQLVAGICSLLLVAYLFGSLIGKSHKDSRAELNAKKNSLYRLSLATGRSEYDLFHKSAEGWSISSDKIEQDFRRYMTDQDMPHYAQDFVRKNRTHLDQSLIVKRKVKPTSWKDWAIAMLVFPGSVLLLYVLMSLFDKYPNG